MGGVISDVMDVVLTPFKEMQKMVTGMFSDQAKAGIDMIEHAGDELGLDTLANEVVDGIGSICEGAGNILNKGTDSLFGTIDFMKYVPMVAIGFVGLFGLKYGAEMISEGGKSYRDRR